MTIFRVRRTVWAVLLFSAATAIAAHAQTFTKIADLGNGTGGSPAYSMFFTQGQDGNLYGTTSNQGSPGGTVFKMTLEGAITVLHTFCSQPPNCADGNYPASGLTLATDGNLYGTTSAGGPGAGGGTIFRLTASGTFTTLQSITDCTSSYSPWGGLMEATDGNLYGTTAGGYGTIFRFDLASDECSLLHQFLLSDGAVPVAAMVEGFDGDLYGTTQRGGNNFYGSVFKYHRQSGVLTNLVTLQGGDDAWPSAPLIPGRNGTFYGTATGGTSGTGALFSVTNEGLLTNLYFFCQQTGCLDGELPIGLTPGTDGNLYGVTAAGGDSPICSFDCGTIFQYSRIGRLTVHNFCEETGCQDGYLPQGGLYQATNGKFYGTTFLGGTYNQGTVFTLDMGLGPFVTFVRAAGKVGQNGGILGQGFTGTTSVSLNGIPANFAVVSDTYINARVPTGATTGYLTVTTPSGVLTSNVPFHVIP
jgi:uncharacterized repeat protein (TIGR03803 family)